VANVSTLSLDPAIPSPNSAAAYTHTPAHHSPLVGGVGYRSVHSIKR